MKRRTFLSAAAAGLGALCTPAIAQVTRGGRPPVIGYLQVAPRTATTHLVAALEAGFRELGYVPGQSLVLEPRFADGQAARLPALAAELVALQPQAVVTVLNNATLAVRGATRTIPIVTALGTDLVETGLVQSLSRPGGNVTGLTLDVSKEILGKRTQILREAVPGVTRIAVLFGPDYQTGSLRGSTLADIEDAARALGLGFAKLELPREPERFSDAYAAVARERGTALYVVGEPFTFQHRRVIAELAVKHRLPSVFGASEHITAGGLIGYGHDLADLFRRAAGHVDRILRGANPAELPIEQPAKFRLVVNQGTAKALGLEIPRLLLLRADQVLE